ncbi:MAG: beta-ketoacyl-[acyl-carrier-protein] synthase family protein [Campylobacterota bacterium]|nr:beta-ketoacyl-[acyl-carrier-protein] synthase family protein [Campylobacterota bacterium]
MSINSNHKSYITATAAYTCVGDTDALMQALYHCQTGISETELQSSDKTVAVGSFKNISFFEALEQTCSEVLAKSKLDSFADTLLIVGSSVGGMAESEAHYFQDGNYKNINPNQHVIHVIAEHLDAMFHFKGIRSLSTACTSSSNALMLAKRLISYGAYKHILVVGADALCHTTVEGFNALGILSDAPCKPFDSERNGMNVAEGIAVLLIERSCHGESIELIGAAGSSDAFHITNPDPNAAGAISAITAALKDAGLETEEVDYINAHGTGTQANDASEALAIETLFKQRPPVSSTKAVTGHTLGAAGALEAVICVEALKREMIPPACNLDSSLFTALNLPSAPVAKSINYVLSNSFAFGGNNVSLLFGRPS